MPPDPVPRALLRQDRSRRTRGRLVEAARALFLTRGFEETTVADVCAAAGVAKGTFFFYFPRKEDLLLELVATGGERLQEWVQERLASDASTAALLGGLIQTLGARLRLAPPALLRQVLRELTRSAVSWEAIRGDRFDLLAAITAIFERARGRGEIAADHDPADLAALVLLATIQGTIGWIDAAGPQRPLETMLWRRISVILAGARTAIAQPPDVVE